MDGRGRDKCSQQDFLVLCISLNQLNSVREIVRLLIQDCCGFNLKQAIWKHRNSCTFKDHLSGNFRINNCSCKVEGPFIVGGANVMSLASILTSNNYSKSITGLSFSKLLMPPFQLNFFHVVRPFSANNFKRKASWSLRSAADGSRLNSSPKDDLGGGTRLIRSIQVVQLKIIARLKELRKNLPVKLFSFLVGFYCATAFATVIGQTGDWDVLSAAVAVAVVEGIGALMYRVSIPLVDDLRNVIVMFNYWKAGLSLGLFLDSFKY
ncbi:Protein of unknown function (DUF565 [Striga hermonthica]|uniref:Ycf20-like protein n=1 Tax=Striga hermonthica TaxID=68872 RepID=A0A9N7MMU1_STRHE|nr:Protein of unknown function (DUF565 [Striga hermonthica]